MLNKVIGRRRIGRSESSANVHRYRCGVFSDKMQPSIPVGGRHQVDRLLVPALSLLFCLSGSSVREGLVEQIVSFHPLEHFCDESGGKFRGDLELPGRRVGCVGWSLIEWSYGGEVIS